MGKDNNFRQLKIGIVLDDSLDKTDGIQQYVRSIGAWLTLEGHEVHYLVGQTTASDLPNVHSLSKNVNVTFNGNKMSMPLPVSRRKLKQFLTSEKFDILHVQMPYSPWLAHRIILAAPAKTVIYGTFHIVAFSRLAQLATKALAFWTRRSLKRFCEVVSVSSAAKDYAKLTYGISTTVLPNVFDYKRFNNAVRMRGKSADTLRVLFLGRLVRRKGCQYLLEAVRLLKAQGQTGFEVIVCGRGPLLSKLEAYAKTHALPVKFVGYVREEDKPAYYASADISVFPSTGGESFGIVLIEAMSSGRSAVVAAANSGYASVLKDRPDLLVPPANAEKLAVKLTSLLQKKAERQSAAAWGAKYSQQFDAPIVGSKLLERYNKCLRNK